MHVIEASQWDSSPIRDLLIALLIGPAHVEGNIGADLVRAEHEGILNFVAWPGKVSSRKHVWQVTYTRAGRVLALYLCDSEELCQIIDLSADAKNVWRGVEPTDVFSELDLRDGGTGNVPNWVDWGRARGREYVEQLPRRVDAGEAAS